MVAENQRILDSGIKLNGPGPGLRVSAWNQSAKVVDNVAASKNQDAMIAQLLDLLPQAIVVPRRAVIVETQLENRDVGIGEKMNQDAPGSVIESPFLGLHRMICSQ